MRPNIYPLHNTDKLHPVRVFLILAIAKLQILRLPKHARVSKIERIKTIRRLYWLFPKEMVNSMWRPTVCLPEAKEFMELYWWPG